MYFLIIDENTMGGVGGIFASHLYFLLSFVFTFLTYKSDDDDDEEDDGDEDDK